MNKVIIIGNLGQDPELRYTANQEAVATLSIASNEVWHDANGEKKEHTEWHRAVVWGKAAENASKYLAKGRQVCIEGKLRTRSYDDKDGVKKYTTEIKVDHLEYLGGKEGQGRSDQPPAQGDRRQNGSQPPAQSNQPQGRPSPANTPGLDEVPF